MQLLRVMRRVDLLESRFASALGHWPPQRSATSELERQLSALEGEMGPSASGRACSLSAILGYLSRPLKETAGNVREPIHFEELAVWNITCSQHGA